MIQNFCLFEALFGSFFPFSSSLSPLSSSSKMKEKSQKSLSNNSGIKFKQLLVAFIILNCISAYAGPVRGVVTDKETGEAEIGAVVQFYHGSIEASGIGEAKVIAYSITDSEGVFRATLSTPGTYTLMVSNMGRLPIFHVFEVKGEEETIIGKLEIENDIEAIKSAQIIAQKPLVKVDIEKITYEVSDDIDAKNSTLLDILRKTPMVSVDGQDNITVNGSSRFQVYVDGKPNQMMTANASQIFKMLPASYVSRIEVVTNPGAQYDAEGAGGILKLTTNAAKSEGKSISDGQYGNIMLQGGTKNYGGGVTYSMQKNKFSFSLNANSAVNLSRGVTNEVGHIQKGQTGNVSSNSKYIANAKMPGTTASLNLGYELDSLNIISIGGGLTRFGTRISGTGSFDIHDFAYNSSMTHKSNSTGLNANADYQHTWKNKPSQHLIISYQFSASPTISSVINQIDVPGAGLPNNMPDIGDRDIKSLTNSLSHIIQTDFSTSFKKNHTINTGIKFIARHNKSEQGTNSASATENYNFFNNIGAIYGEYKGNYGPVSLTAGLRYEHTWQEVRFHDKINDFSLDYGNLVPGGNLQFNIKANQNIGLGYNMRISRPGISFLNPFVDNSDPILLKYGNPSLSAEKGHNISLKYNYFTAKWVVSASINGAINSNGISEYSFTDGNSILNTTYGNIVSSNTLSSNVFVNWSPSVKTRLYSNVSVNRSRFVSDELDQKNAGWGYSFMLGGQQVLPWDLRLGIFGYITGRSITLQGYSDGISIANISLAKSFLNDKLNISLSAMSNITGGKGMTIGSYSESKDFSSRTLITVPIRMVAASVSWSFGKASAVTKSLKKKNIDDIQLNSSSGLGESIDTNMKF